VSSPTDDPSAPGYLAALRTYERANQGSPWRPVLGPWQAETGSGHLLAQAARREGDRSTPIGVFGIGRTMYGNKPNPGGLHYAYHRVVCTRSSEDRTRRARGSSCTAGSSSPSPASFPPRSSEATVTRPPAHRRAPQTETKAEPTRGRTVWSTLPADYIRDALTSREDSTVQLPVAPVVISAAASQKLGTNWLVMNWLRARARIVMSILFVGTRSRHPSG